MVIEGFKYGVLEEYFNKTLILLIPKVVVPKSVSQFKPISLCTMSYKILSKVIVNRLKSVMPILVARNQTSFVGGRNIMDNVVIV